MDFKDTPEDAAFRQEVKDFLKTDMPADLRAADDAVLGVGIGEDERERDWLRTLAKRGWVAPAWPKQYGGAGLSVMQQFIFNEEMARARAPRPNFLAIGLAGPTIIVHGTEEQKREHLPASSPARRSGARDSASPEAAPIWRRCRRAPSPMATTSSSMARRYGRRAHTAQIA